MATDPLRDKLDQAADRADAASTAFYAVLTNNKETPVPVEGGTVDSMSKRIYDQVGAQIDAINEKADEAAASAASANASKDAAANSATQANNAKTAAEGARDTAVQAKDQAQTAAQASQASAVSAQYSASNSSNSASQAADSANTASTSANQSTQAKDAANVAKNAAQASEASAASSKNAAATSASNSASSEAAAKGYSEAALAYRDSSLTNANSAAASATQSATSAAAALASAQEAKTSATSAASANTSAQSSKDAAATSAASASQSATNAASSATVAGQKETGAIAAANNAETSKTQAQAASTSAQGFATQAQASATEASGYLSDVEQSAADASVSATSAQDSKDAAALSATSAQGSATSAASSASAAATSAQEAAASVASIGSAVTDAQAAAQSSENSATAAEASATQAANSAASITSTVEFAQYTFESESAMVTDGGHLPDGAIVYLRDTGKTFEKSGNTYVPQVATNPIRAVLSYGTYSEAQLAAATLPDGQVVQVDISLFTVSGGILSLQRPATPIKVIPNFVRSVQDKLNKEFVSVLDFGATGDGVFRTLGEKFTTLEDAQFVYPHATSLNQSQDWAALIGALNSGVDWVHAPKGLYMMTDTVIIPDGVQVVGDGVDLWMPGVMDFQGWRLSDDHGTHFYSCGTGDKSHSINNLSNTSPSRTNEGTTYDFTDFTLRDSVAGSPATPKPFSVAWIVGRNSGIQNCRIIPSNNKLAGYLDRSVTTLSDDWDVGVWLLHPQDSYCFNVQSVGHWRMAAWLQTENDSGTASWTTSERANIEKCMGAGVRGRLIRHHPAYWITANTANTVTVKWNETFTLTRFNTVRINGVTSTYTGYTFNAADRTVTLTGVSPAIVGNIANTALRSAYSGNNLSNTVYKDSIFSTIDHNTYQPSEALGLPVSFASEYDGFPLRNLVNINTVSQTRYDKGNSLWGHCQDFKYVACKHENGALIAFDAEEAGPLHANNMRFIAEDSIWYESQLWGFKPRSAIVDSYQNNQQGTDGAFYQRPLPGKRLVLQNQGSQEILTTGANNGDVTLWNGAHTARIELPDDGVGRIRMDTLRFINGSGVESGRLSGTTWELKGNTIVTGYIRQSTDNVSPFGGASNRATTIYLGTNPVVTSDAREKTEKREIPDAVLDAFGELSIVCWEFLKSINEKGEMARTHYGIFAQDLRDALVRNGAMTEGSTYCKHAPLCYDEWGDEYEPVIAVRNIERQVIDVIGTNEDGTPIEKIRYVVEQEEYDTGEVQLVRAAGNRWGIRADQCLFLEAAYQRRRADRIEARLDAAGI